MGLLVALLATSCSSDSGTPGPAGGGSASGGGTGAGGSAAGAAAGGGAASTAGSPSGSSGTAGMSATGGTAGMSAGGTSTGGASGAGGSGGAAGSTVGGAAGSGGGSGSGGGGNCTPNAAASFMVNGEVVFDPKTCLSWTKATMAGQPYAEAETYCGGLSLGGYDDWRLPTAGEVVSIFKCNNMQPPVADVFTVMGDGIWTTTLTGTIAGDQPKVCGAGQASGQFYDFGKVGGQNTRCVRGVTSLPDRTDCKTNTMICAK